MKIEPESYAAHEVSYGTLKVLLEMSPLRKEAKKAFSELFLFVTKTPLDVGDPRDFDLILRHISMLTTATECYSQRRPQKDV